MSKGPTVEMDKFLKRLDELSKVANARSRDFLRNEGRLLARELAKSFSPKKRKSEKGIGIDRRVAFRTRVHSGGQQLPWRRLRTIIQRQRPGGAKPIVAAVIAKASEKKAIQRLGTLAAGFIGQGNRLKVGGVAAFVRHNIASCYGKVTLRFGLLANSVRIHNWTPWLRDMKGREFLVKRSLGRRAGAMRKQAELIKAGVRDYWGKR